MERIPVGMNGVDFLVEGLTLGTNTDAGWIIIPDHSKSGEQILARFHMEESKRIGTRMEPNPELRMDLGSMEENMELCSKTVCSHEVTEKSRLSNF